MVIGQCDVEVEVIDGKCDQIADEPEGVDKAVNKEASDDASKTLLSRSKHLVACIVSPGMLACLADTDSGCLAVAAQSGASWGYSLMFLQVLLIPVLFMAQELTARLGVYTQMGHTACIRLHYGRFWGYFAAIPLIFQCSATLVSELAGISAVAELWGLGSITATLVAATVIVLVVFCFRYWQIEIIGVVLGLFELSFVVSMFCYHPDPKEVFLGAIEFSSEKDFLSLVAENIGAVIMPWMIYFQQSAVVARGLKTEKQLNEERASTFAGSFLTQFIMIATLMTLAAANPTSKSVENVQDIVDAMSPHLGEVASKVFVSFAFIGGSLSAAFVVTMASAWSLCEATGVTDKEALSLNVPIRKAKLFYGSFVVVVISGIIILMSGVDEVVLMEAVVLMDAMLMPFTVGFLYLLATSNALPEEVRVKGWKKFVLGFIFGLVSIICICSTIYGFIP